MRRFPREHPVAFGTFMSIIAALTVMIGGRVLDRGWPPDRPAIQMKN
jgi:hypothetical protein